MHYKSCEIYTWKKWWKNNIVLLVDFICIILLIQLDGSFHSAEGIQIEKKLQWNKLMTIYYHISASASVVVVVCSVVCIIIYQHRRCLFLFSVAQWTWLLKTGTNLLTSSFYCCEIHSETHSKLRILCSFSLT